MHSQSPSTSKRKLSAATADSSSNDVIIIEKRPRVTSAIVKLQGAKFVLSQKPVPPLLAQATLSLRELVEWKEWLASASDEAKASGLPPRFFGLVVKLCHESDRAIPQLSRTLRADLIPVGTNDHDPKSGNTATDPFSFAKLETIILSHLTRVNYGLTPEDVGIASTSKMPAGLTIWRWEANDRKTFLPPDSLSQLEARFKERQEARDVCKTIWNNLGSSEKEQLLSGNPPGGSAKNKQKAVVPTPKVVEKKVTEKARIQSPSKSLQKKPKKEDPEKEARKAEKAILDAEKAEKRAAKEASNREKKERDEEVARDKAEAKRKEENEKKAGAALMGLFLSKNKQPVEKNKKQANDQATDFQKTFLPFSNRNHVELAPENRFLIEKRKLLKNGIEVGDGIDIDPEHMTRQDFLNNFLSSVAPSRIPHRVKYPASAIKTGPMRMSVREVVARSQDAEISGNGDPHQITAQLNDQRLFRRKFLQFREDIRPAYFGTWTQSSTLIGPRTPFAQDMTHFDYSYDSGCDWDEDDEEGEDVQSLSGGSPKKKPTNGNEGSMWDTDDEDEDFDGEGESDSGDEDGFFVSDEEGVGGPDDGSVLRRSPSKEAEGSRKKDKSQKHKKREVLPLVPVVRGPYFEHTFGSCSSDVFQGYQIQLLNDTPLGLDPFTFVAEPIRPPARSQPSSLPTDSQSKLSSLPRHLFGTMPPPSSASSPGSSSTISKAHSKPRPKAGSSPIKPTTSPFGTASSPHHTPPVRPKGPKTPFPQQHLAQFLGIVSQSTKKQVSLLDELQETFKPVGITKVQLTDELRKRAKRAGIKEGSPWKVIDDA